MVPVAPVRRIFIGIRVLKGGVNEAQNRDDTGGYQAQCKGADTASFEGTEFGDEAYGGHCAGDEPFGDLTADFCQIEGVFSGTEDKAIVHMQGNFGEKSEGAQKGQGQEKEDEGGDQLCIVDGAPDEYVLFAAPVGENCADGEYGRTEQGDSGEFDDGGDFTGKLAVEMVGKPCGNDLRGGVDGQAAPFAIHAGFQVEKCAKNGESEHGEYAEQVDGGNGDGDVFFTGFYDRSSGNNGRTSADCGADADE